MFLQLGWSPTLPNTRVDLNHPVELVRNVLPQVALDDGPQLFKLRLRMEDDHHRRQSGERSSSGPSKDLAKLALTRGSELSSKHVPKILLMNYTVKALNLTVFWGWAN